TVYHLYLNDDFGLTPEITGSIKNRVKNFIELGTFSIIKKPLHSEYKQKVMEKRFKSLSLFEFQKRFPDEESCVAYLASLKWKDGYRCKKCGHGHYCRGIEKYDRQCTKCRRLESPKSGTLFHRCKFPLL